VDLSSISLETGPVSSVIIRIGGGERFARCAISVSCRSLLFVLFSLPDDVPVDAEGNDNSISAAVVLPFLRLCSRKAMECNNAHCLIAVT
jgi:hypothetical protein